MISNLNFAFVTFCTANFYIKADDISGPGKESFVVSNRVNASFPLKISYFIYVRLSFKVKSPNFALPIQYPKSIYQNYSSVLASNYFISYTSFNSFSYHSLSSFSKRPSYVSYGENT